MIEMLSSRLKSIKGAHYGLARRCVKPSHFFWTIFILDFGPRVYRQVVGVPMDTNCARFVADLFIFCYEMDFIMSLYADKDAGVVGAFGSTSGHLDDVLNIDDTYFGGVGNQICSSGLQLSEANSSDAGPRFWIYIWLFQMALFLLEFRINAMISIS